ncbi:toll/interleukin-1 receptor-like protein [Arachis hypogaea]|uniref:toll/interleukin-1 receptor-like protein n=1 Tax=Arachis hypogaea TaxID=3818 RepID=UPI0010FC5370|nr:TMV resistance protein N-like [Arachis hypogaea]QHO54048.1 TMV resistance protein N [Arachis hypogaea]
MSAERIPDPSWKYDVYLSFRGQDTRSGFTSHLYDALRRAGIHAFRDDEALGRGDQMTYILVQAIEASRLFVVVFSESYAASTWCLNELMKIMECRSTRGQTVIPVFYNVDPSDIRHQSGPFEKAFQSHRFSYENEIVHAWRAALTEAANLLGFLITGSR